MEVDSSRVSKLCAPLLDIDILLIQVFKDVLIAESFRAGTFNSRVTEKDLHKIDTLDSLLFTNPIINTILLWNPRFKK